MTLYGVRLQLSPWFHSYMLGLGLACAAIVARPASVWKWSLFIGGVWIVVTAVARVISVPTRGAFFVTSLPSGQRSVLSSLLPEGDGAVLAAGMLGAKDGGEALMPVLREAYRRMGSEVGMPETPAIRTYLGLQSARAFDAIIATPEGPSAPTRAIVFLHGFSGNFDVYCWHLSLAARRAHALVVCPSLGPVGDWWTKRGLTVVQKTIQYVTDRHIEHVYLAGLSNGAAGAAVLAPQLPGLDGLILISGAARTEPPPDVPLLVIQGERDGMMPASLARDYVSRAWSPHTYVSIDGGHFVFLSHTREVTEAITQWLRYQRKREW
jgi:pimeloyl-ACP methyl ester carboxylesterase